ncbi:MAG TPA: BlaI/MecI/CopY family transcriptional regulator [Anaerohalosphaeraceae bacterium]|nr:BlaI/MecI/CopY family transcriptional regulator [Anaerohalosphaeraceae bacterium]
MSTQAEKPKTPHPVSLELTEVEWTIMKVVWDNQPCAAGTVQDALAEEKGWAYSTVKTTMDRMVQKGLLEIKKIRNLQLFSSAISKSSARKGEFQKMLSRAFDGALGPMMQYLVENEKLTDDDIKQLRQLVGKTKK